MKRNGEKGRLIRTNHSLTPGFGRLQCNLKRGLQGRRAIICSQINHVSNRAKIPLRLGEAIIIQIIFIRLHCYSDSLNIIQTSCQTSLCVYSACKCVCDFIMCLCVCQDIFLWTCCFLAVFQQQPFSVNVTHVVLYLHSKGDSFVVCFSSPSTTFPF